MTFCDRDSMHFNNFVLSWNLQLKVFYNVKLRNSLNSWSCDVAVCSIKMVNGFRYYRALESVSIASALSTALTIYPCQIRVHQR